MRLASIAAACAVALLAAGCRAEDPESASTSPEDARRGLAGAPPPLAALHERGNQLLDGGPSAFKAELERLEGHAIVVNKWASWCGPCRFEFPFFQRQAKKHGKEIAFIGVNSNDNDSDAERFLAEYPVPYPSFRDPDQEVAAEFKGGIAFPTTAFYDSKGELATVKQGQYSTEADLERDILRYAR